MGQLEWRQGNVPRAREVFELGLGVLGPCAPLLAALAQLELQGKHTRRARCGGSGYDGGQYRVLSTLSRISTPAWYPSQSCP